MKIDTQELDIEARKVARRNSLMELNLTTRVVEDKKRKKKSGYRKHKKKWDDHTKSSHFLFSI